MEKIGYKPNAVTYGTIMNDLCKIGEITVAIRILRKMEKGNLELNVVMYNTIIDSLCKDRLVNEALNFLSEMKNRGIRLDVFTYNSLILGLCSFARWKETTKLLTEMVERKIMQNVHTFNILVDTLGMEGKLTEADEVFNVMIQRGIEPDTITYNSLIDECKRSVLDNLQPHSNLKSLTINNYGAESLPDWVVHHSFSNITFLRLENCKHCLKLPPLGQLPSLQNLSVVGFEGVVKVDREFYGSDSSSVKPFGALKVLRFEQMLKWEEWSSSGAAENEGGTFPQLEELYIDSCPKQRGGLPVHLPSLTKLEIHKCPQLVASLPRAPASGFINVQLVA
ncbi:pentatricopeptide repeat-containing protein At1g63080, mitochondrial-like [Corylus avellana]|uniref:pentatricopeptide repeat-containing protein At1g63080, mitochondrial-like n=1 Tax=Corylus avellana TaxID=13451 RepID=UPI00286AB73F|nr:pentatricopeptide repeat-containing protein At1g63080, mitochondrial-like [Corylus avellana]